MDQDYDLNALNKDFKNEKELCGVKIDLKNIISIEELKLLESSFLKSREFAGFKDVEVAALLNWAINVRTDATLIDMIINGDAEVDMLESGEITFYRTNKGE